MDDGCQRSTMPVLIKFKFNLTNNERNNNVPQSPTQMIDMLTTRSAAGDGVCAGNLLVVTRDLTRSSSSSRLVVAYSTVVYE